MKRVLAVIFSFTILIQCSFAQSFSSLKKSNGNNPFTVDIFKLYGRTTFVSSTYTPDYNGWTINIGIADNDYKKWGTRIRYENPTLGDFLSRVPAAIREVKAIVNDEPSPNGAGEKWEDHAHGGGIFGWMQFYTNAVATDRLLVSPGVSFGDYMYGSRYKKTPSSEKLEQGPYGYYVVVGPGVMATYLLNKNLWIDAYINYDFSAYKVKNNESPANYPKPNFLTIGSDFHTVKNFFGGIRLNKLIDRGENNDNNSSRLDISAGLLF